MVLLRALSTELTQRGGCCLVFVGICLLIWCCLVFGAYATRCGFFCKILLIFIAFFSPSVSVVFEVCLEFTGMLLPSVLLVELVT